MFDKEQMDQLGKLLSDHTAVIRQMVLESQQKHESKVNELREKAEKAESGVSDHLDRMQKMTDSIKVITDRILALEQMGVAVPKGDITPSIITPGQLFTDSDVFKGAVKLGNSYTGKADVKTFHAHELGRPLPGQTAIVNATGQNQPLVQDYRVPGIILPTADRMMTIRDLLPVFPTTTDLIQFVKENVFTNNAAPQGAGTSPQVFENVAKAESGITFTLENEPVQTLAHWIPASRQILSDSPMLQAFINSRLTYGLKMEEEEQLLLGDGTGANLNGLVTQATAYDATLDVGGDTKIDKLAHALFQVVRDGEFTADGIVMNHKEWHDIQLIKTTGASSSGEYIFSDPHGVQAPRIWGRKVVPTNTMTATKFLVAAFTLAAAIWDRWAATVEVSREHSDFFTKNMVAILAEERIALTVFRPKALVYGTF